MRFRCSVHGCMSTSYRCNNGTIRYFRFPKNENRAQKWIRACQREDLINLNTKSRRNKVVCSLHFEKNMFAKMHLKVTAIPTINLPLPDMLVGDVGSSLQDDTLNDIIQLPQVRMIIAGVYRYLHVEYNNLKSSIGDTCDLSPLANILKRTAEATGVSEETVSIILEKGKPSVRPRKAPKLLSKRTKFKDVSEDEDVSFDEEESSSGSSSNVQKSDKDEEEKEDQCEPMETLKAEFEEDMDHSNYINERKKNELESTPCQTTSEVKNWLPTTQVIVKAEPLDEEEDQTTSPVHVWLSSTQTVVKVQPLEMDEHSESSAIRHFSPSSLVKVKQEPSDVLHRQLTPVTLHEPLEEGLDPLRSEPDGYTDRTKLTENRREYRQKKKTEKQSFQLKQIQQQNQDREKYIVAQHNNSNMEDSTTQSKFQEITSLGNKRLTPVALHQAREERLNPLKTERDDQPDT